MNPTSIYSKTGKGVQEASGKTSFLSRGDRAILAAIDGKTTVQQLGKKFDRAADDKFMALLQKMDAEGFIREVSPGTVQRGAANAPRPAAPAGPKSVPTKPAGGGGAGEDLDFTQIFSAPPKMEKPPAAAPSKPPPTPSKDPMAAAREAAEQRARAEREAKAKAEAAEKAAMMSTQQFRLDAEMRAKIEREKVMAAAAEGKTRAEIEARERAEREAKARAEAEAKAKAEAEARAKVEAERQAKERAEIEAKERAEREVREKAQAAERARFEAAERARREAEELRFKIEEERRAREEAERRAREEAELRVQAESAARAEAEAKIESERRARAEAERLAQEEARTQTLAARQARDEAEAMLEAARLAREEAEALRRKYEEEKKAREEAERRAEQERQRREQQRLEEERKAREAYEAERKQREEEERKEAEEHQRQIRLAREAEDKKRRDAEAKKKKEEEAKRWEVEEARRKADDAYRQRAEQEDKERAEREALEAAERAEAEKRQAAEADALAGSLLADLDTFSQRQDEEKKQKEEEDRRSRAEAERRAREEEAQRAREEAERKARKEEERRRREEEEARAREEEEQRQREEEARRKEEEAEKKRKEREEAARKPEGGDIPITPADLGMGDVDDDARKMSPEARKALRDRQREVARARTRGETAGGTVAAAARRRKQPTSWGKPVALFLFFTLLIGAGVANLVPLDAREYEKMATDALGAPVKIGGARLYVLAGVQVRFERVTIGEAVKIGQVRAVPELGALLGDDKAFSRVELEDVTLRQDALGAVLFGAMQPGRLRVARVTATQAKLEGPLALPPLDVDASIGATGKLFSVKLSGDRVNGLVTPRDQDLSFEVSASSFAVPFVDKLTITEFAMKGSADRAGMTIAEFDGRAFDGTLLGNARIRWGETWSVQGDVQARTLNAAVFSPQMVSEGRLGAKGRYAMSGPDPAKLYESASLVGDFEVAKGALGSFDLSRALQSTSAQASGRTPFTEMQGSVSLVNGALAFRDLRLSAGLLNATGTLDVDPKGALSGRVNAELRNLRGTLYIGGKLSDPQLRR